MHKVRITLFLLMAAAILVLALCAGPRTINPLAMTATEREILLSIRLPRVAVALLMGMALALPAPYCRASCVTRWLTLISWGSPAARPLQQPSAFLRVSMSSADRACLYRRSFGASLVSILVGAFGWKRGGLWPERLLLAGIGLNFLFSAVLMLLMSLSSDEGLRRASFGCSATSLWLTGR